MAIQAGNPIGGVLLHERRVESLGNHLDLPSVKGLATYQNMTKMGPRDLWAYANMSEVPFMYEQLMASNVELVNGNKYSFELPTSGSHGTKVVSVEASNPAKIGYGQEPFKLTVTNKSLGSHGAHITFDPTSPYVMEVVGFQIKGEQITYDVVYKGSHTKEDFIPAHLFQPGSQLYKLAGFRSKEFGQEYDSWQAEGFTNREYLGFLTNTEIQTHYHITDQAANFFEHNQILDPKMLMDSLNKVVEYVGIESPIQSGVKNFEDWVKAGGQPGQIGFKAIATKYDDISMQILNRENMNVVVWHPGSMTDGNSYDQQFVAPGIWHQLDYNGYKMFYNIETLSQDVILSAIQSFNSGKVAVPDYGKEPTYKIRTGIGGRNLLNQIFKEYVTNNVTGIVDAFQAGQLSGNNKDGIEATGAWYRSITVPGIAKLTIEVDRSFDNNNTNDILNPRLSTGFRLTSYSMIIEDYNTSNSNIKIFRNKNLGKQVRMEVIAGDRTHPMFETSYMGATAHLGSHLQTGYGAYFRSTPDTGVVVDPTKILKLIPKNPFNPNGNSL